MRTLEVNNYFMMSLDSGIKTTLGDKNEKKVTLPSLSCSQYGAFTKVVVSEHVTPKPKKRDTLTRKDVMQKTIFRALRKEYAEFFLQFLKWKNLPCNFGIGDFREYINQFVVYIMGWESSAQLYQNYGEFKNMSFIIALMVDFCKVKKLQKTREECQLMDQFYQALYKYSHTKFDSLLGIPEVKFLFKKILDAGYIETFTSKHNTLAKNEKEYKKCAESIIHVIDYRQYSKSRYEQ